jgi:DnaJ-domain-containing protein 1
LASDPFTVLGLPRRLCVADAEVAKTARDLLRDLHPDRFYVQGPGAVADAERRASEVNDAVRQLRDLTRRAACVSGFGDDAGKVQPPQALLAQVFDWNERIDEGHGADLVAEVTAARAAATRKLENAAANWDQAAQAGGATVAEEQALRDVLGEMRYLDNLLQRAG